jgi:hypothetical protein
MENSTLCVRVLEASRHPNVMLAFACLSKVLSTRQRLAIIRVVTPQNGAPLNQKGGVQ